MIKRELTNTYLSIFDLLTEALYLCWTNSFCEETDQLIKTKLRAQIRSYGFYDHKHAIKKEKPINFVNNFEFKTLVWVNKFSNAVNQDALCSYVELYKQVVDEIENNLFTLKIKTAQIAYANILLRNLDKSHIHKRKIDIIERDKMYKEMFELVLDRKFVFDDETAVLEGDFCDIHANYDLTVRLINHLDFIDKLIDVFLCFDIDLISLANKSKHNLYIFNNNKRHNMSCPELKKFSNDIHFNSDKCKNCTKLCCRRPDYQKNGTSIDNDLIFPNIQELKHDILPKFNSTLTDDCLVKIMQYLFHKKMLDNPNSDVWLFWFNRKYIKVPEPLKWKGSPSMLSNIIQHMCGESISNTIKTAFCTKEYIKPTKSKYERSKMHKEIEQIIIISKQKNS